jgi:hypothetical protein
MPNAAKLQYIRKTERGAAKQRERSIQRAITKHLLQEYPGVDFFNDWASGAYLTKGQNLARLGIQPNAGWADLFIPYPSRGYHGLFVELKREGVKIYRRDGKMVTNDQIQLEAQFITRMNKLGYLARFAIGYDKAQ